MNSNDGLQLISLLSLRIWKMSRVEHLMLICIFKFQISYVPRGTLPTKGSAKLTQCFVRAWNINVERYVNLSFRLHLVVTFTNLHCTICSSLADLRHPQANAVSISFSSRSHPGGKGSIDGKASRFPFGSGRVSYSCRIFMRIRWGILIQLLYFPPRLWSPLRMDLPMSRSHKRNYTKERLSRSSPPACNDVLNFVSDNHCLSILLGVLRHWVNIETNF